MMVDMFPMADGKRPSTCNTYTTLEKSSVAYDKNVPFANRDPRFYRTFAFPGGCSVRCPDWRNICSYVQHGPTACAVSVRKIVKNPHATEEERQIYPFKLKGWLL